MYSAREKQEEAIIAILRTIQTWNEYVEVTAEQYGNRRPWFLCAAGEALVQNALDRSEKWQFNWLRQQLSHYSHRPDIPKCIWRMFVPELAATYVV